MKRRRVRITSRALEQMHSSAMWWAENRSVRQAARWLAKIERAIKTLSIRAQMYPRSLEEGVEVDAEIREMLFGVSSRPTHRVVYSVSAEEVVVHAVMHVAQK